MTQPAHQPAPGDALPLSVCVICKDNEKTIARTFDSVRAIASEIVVVDSGSTDRTLELARNAGAIVHQTDWPGYIAQKNRALELCTMPWVLSLDSDESIDDECARALRDAIASDNPSVGGYEINRRVYWNGAPLRRAWQPEWRLRLVRAGTAAWDGYDPHDELRLTSGARTERLKGEMRHDAIDTIGEFLARQVAHGRTAARALHERGERGSVRALATSPLAAWFKMLVLRGAYKDGWRGWAASSSVALASIAKHACLLELTMTDKRTDR